MRIVAVCGFAWEPKGTVRARAFPILAELVRRGHEAILLSVPYDNTELSGNEFTLEGVLVKSVELGSAATRMAKLPMRTVAEITALKPDVVYVFKPKGYAGAIAWLLLRNGTLPVCLDCDDWEGWGGWNELKRYPHAVKSFIDWQETTLTRRAHAVTAVSQILMERCIRIRQSQSRAFYAPNCVSAQQFELLGEIAVRNPEEAKIQLSLPPRPLVFYAGHFEPIDDVIFFCRAVTPALRAGAMLIFVGEGEDQSKAKEYFSGLQLKDKVSFMGRLSYGRYLSVLAAADVTCFPYPDNAVYHSKCSARIIDYMSAEKAVLTTNIGQNPEYIENGKSGLLIEPSSAAKFADALQFLISRPDVRTRLGLAARQKIAEEFQWSKRSVNECEKALNAAIAYFNGVQVDVLTSKHEVC